jgi:hypothetical protein
MNFEVENFSGTEKHYTLNLDKINDLISDIYKTTTA